MKSCDLSWVSGYSQKRRLQTSRTRSDRRARRIAFEPLEDRRLLSVTAQLLKDINPTTHNSMDSQFSTLARDFSVDVDGEWFFVANDGIHGQELWKSDGTSTGTVLVKDIYPGTLNGQYPASSRPQNMTNVNGTLFFTAYDGDTGTELWKSDGTEAGTVRVKDINLAGPSEIGSLFDYNGTLFFGADDGINGSELWKSDGTEGGTVMVKDISAGSHYDYNYGELRPNSSVPEHMAIVNGTLFFTVDDRINGNGHQLWTSDGTNAGTVPVKELGSSADWAGELTNVNGTLYFFVHDTTNGSHPQLWKSDGTTASTELVKELVSYPGVASDLTNVNGTLYFIVDDRSSGSGPQLWKSDGTEGGTVRVNVPFPGGEGSASNPVNVDGTLFFTGVDGVHGNGLWKSDGTETGTVLVKAFGIVYKRHLTIVNGTLFFAATLIEGNGQLGETELWKSDGTEAGTTLVTDIAAGSVGSSPFGLTNVNGTLYFYADDGIHGIEPWILVAPPVELLVDPDTIEDDLQAAVSDVQAIPSGSGAAPPEVQLSVTSTELDAVVAAVEALAPSAGTPVVTIVVTLADGDYEGQSVAVPAGVRLVIDGTGSSITFEGASPALTVSSGDVVVRGVTFVNSTDAPTILVTGGSLTLRDSFVRETSGGSRAAIEITGGSVDLGTTELPGDNTIDVSGSGELVRNLSSSVVHAVGNTLQVDGTTLTDALAIEDFVFHGLDVAGLGIVDVGGSLYVGVGGSLQSAIDAAPPNTTIHVAAGVTDNYSVGTKLITIAFENGLTVSQHADEIRPWLRTMTLNGTPNDDVISFTRGMGTSEIHAEISGLPIGTFEPSGRLVAVGDAGHDDITVDAGVALNVVLNGGDGNDRLKGGGGHDNLLGGAGDDLLIGGVGRDFLIGGIGADRIVGNADEDILVAGTTDYDAQDAALFAILAEWTSTRSYAERTANIGGTGSGTSFASRENGNYFLNTVSVNGLITVHDDNVKDTLTGSAGEDWFFANLFLDSSDDAEQKDKITDLHSTEFALDLDFIGA